MSAPALARDRSGRRYMIPDPAPDGPPIECPSVTTILNNINKPALVNWAALEVAKYAYQARDTWHQLEEQAAIDLLKRAPYRDSRQKMDIGSAVHAAVDAHIKKGTIQAETEPPTVDIELLPYVAGAARFLDDYVRRVIHSEVTFVNLTYRYAGTCDLVAELLPAHQLKERGIDDELADQLGSQICVVDWKTGKRLYPEVALQLSAYANNEFACHPDGTRWNIAPVTAAIAVHLDGNAGYTAQPIQLSDQLFRTFVALRTLQKWRDTLEDSVLGDPLPVRDRGDVNGWLAQQGVATAAS